ncbi:hypothetical protein [Lactococcus taiwanensis]|uniref:hypothetical protein n=1 Tax=Lactococcus taiwanensis TaxID=1151742 RepID=UPI001904B569|nr:hypothetical protein [Lactococcus taiwanensis]
MDAALVTIAGTLIIALVNSFWLNQKLNKQKLEYDKTIEEYKLALDRRKKVSSMYYEKRAELIIQLYEKISVYYSNLLAMNKGLIAFQEMIFERPEAYDELYHSTLKLEKDVGKQILLASLYLGEKTSEELMFFQHRLGNISNSMVDVYEEYKRIDKKYPKRSEDESEASKFYWEYYQIYSGQDIHGNVEWLDGKGSKKILDFKKTLKNAILSEE